MRLDQFILARRRGFFVQANNAFVVALPVP
jgi:hypothetical protein